jgi:hypothetical protein
MFFQTDISVPIACTSNNSIERRLLYSRLSPRRISLGLTRA